MFSQLARFRKSWWYSIELILQDTVLSFFYVCCNHHRARIPKYWKEFLTFCHVQLGVSIYCKKKVVTYNNSWPCSNSFVLIFVAVRRRALYLSSIQLCITFLYILCSKCDDQKSRDEPTSLSIASTISLLPPFSGIFCFKNTGGKLLFLLFFSCESSSITSTALQSKIGKISFTKSVRQKTAVWNTTMQHFRAFKLQQFHFIIKIALLEWIAFIFTPALSIIKLCAWMLMCTSLNAIRSIVQWRKMSKERWER